MKVSAIKYIPRQGLLCLILLSGLSACHRPSQNIILLDCKNFDTTIHGAHVDLYTLRSGNGLIAQVTNFGGRIVALWTPDRSGHLDDIVLGCSHIGQYLNDSETRFFGPIIGRYANRIAQGGFSLNGIEYSLNANPNGITSHGGRNGLDMVVWHVDSLTGHSIRLSHTSPNGDNGFPGTLHITADYTLTEENEFIIKYSATTDRPTIVNLTHHAMFNLKGAGEGNITDHFLTIYADHITPTDRLQIPTGEIMPVENTPFDFRTPTRIADQIDNSHEQIIYGQGYDHNWVITDFVPGQTKLVASVYEPSKGRRMEVWSDQPGIQFYSGNFLDDSVRGKSGHIYTYRGAFALETQNFPDAPHHPNFPSARLDPGDTYTHICIYKFPPPTAT